jgi:Fe-S cluster assembly iron-binding protein IscA
MDTEQIFESIKQIVDSKSGKYLKDIQVDILREVMILRSHLKMFII